MMAARLSLEEEDHKKDEGFQTKPNNSNYIEAYTKSIRAVEYMLKLDRLRQESAMFNMLARWGFILLKFIFRQNLSAAHKNNSTVISGLRMKRCISLPNNVIILQYPFKVFK